MQFTVKIANLASFRPENEADEPMDRTVTVRGNSEAVKKAVALINAKVRKEP